MPLNFAVLGAGRIGKVHAQGIAANSDARLVAIADALPDAATSLADMYNCEVRSIDTIIASGDIDAVVICTPTDTHADLIERSVRAGKAVFCEKPIDLSLRRVKDCLKVVESEKGRLMVGFNRRFDPDFMAVHGAIARGDIGAVEMVTITSRDP
ncbi:MAG: Gfo/Idh/MocA family oxidoreductase, partial [Rhodobacteraceae bacterium]|nr:Gfo/Idh/MocA family oxidoreductase [Paracoccaceae bacterium]